MSALLAQLGGNPFNTVVGQKIEQATDASLASENWALNMEICDIVNDTDEGPKDAIRAIRKRLMQNAGKNYTVVMYALTVLETCVKNCGRRFHLLVSQKDFIQDLVKMIGPKNDPPTAVQEKVLSLIQCWADAFRTHPDMQGVVQVYTDLKNKGVEFPMTDLDSMAPIYTPQRIGEAAQESRTKRDSVPLTAPPPTTLPRVNPYAAHGRPVAQSEVESGALPPSPVGLTPEQLNKLRKELDIVQRNMTVFGEMLTELVPGQEQHSEWELLQELQKTCHAMQTRVVELINKVANEEVTGELLRINDDMNNLFLRYERFEKRRTAIVTGQVKDTSATATAQNENSSASDAAPLIDLGEPDVTSDLQKLALGPAGTGGAGSNPAAKPSGDEFDMFAQSRHSSDTKPSGSTYADNTNIDQLAVGLGALAQVRGQKSHRERDFDEMEEWLREKPSETGQESITSTEFDRFLAERAAAAERLPPVTAGSTTATATSIGGPTMPPAPPPSRNRVERDEKTENSLFAL
ncbi:target of Myb1 membrane trafficking protein isoform X2 [Dermacentor andersoni]|uniref:target of Myb1 membrane trafficking protein isoform X2 n=1 Tax=Dermacentor andersoni TaxID=34620 RepID=UPI002155F4AB|nr:target of Myb1 membrane trafficking protein-like isoform X2 [Dermacentor andersoni]